MEPETEDKLAAMAQSGLLWRFHAFRDPEAPGDGCLAASLRHAHADDVVVMHSETSAVAYRVPNHPSNTDKFAPGAVTWFRAGTVADVIGALATLPAPGHPREPRSIRRLPDRLWVPKRLRGNEVVRLAKGPLVSIKDRP